MKGIFTSLFIILSCLQAFSQSYLDSYESPIDFQTYSIQIANDPEGIVAEPDEFVLLVDMMSVDDLYEGGVFLNKEQLANFREDLMEAQKTYDKWRGVAIKNDVKDLMRELKVKSSCGAYFSITDYQIDYDVELTYYFNIFDAPEIDTTLYSLAIKTLYIQDSKNDYITSKGFMMVFTDSDQITEFLGKISEEKIEKYFSKEDLFQE